MIGEAIALSGFALAAILFYVWRGMDDKQPAFKFVYFALAFFFLIGAIYQIGLLAEQPVVRLENITTTYTYAGGNLTTTLEQHQYNNYSSELQNYGDNVFIYNEVLTWFLMIILLIVGIRILFAAVEYHQGKKNLAHGDGSDRPY